MEGAPEVVLRGDEDVDDDAEAHTRRTEANLTKRRGEFTGFQDERVLTSGLLRTHV